MNEAVQFALFGASLIYFWTVMFDRFSRACSILAGIILIGTAGTALKSDAEEPFFSLLTAIGFVGLLLARSWTLWKEWLNDHKNL